MLARLPGLLILNLIGSQSANSNNFAVVVLLAITLIGLGVIYRYRQKLEQALTVLLGKDSFK